MESAIRATKQYPLRNDLKVPPTEDEVLEALGKLKEKKAAGKNGILPEMVKGCGGWMMEYILDLFSTVWKEERVREEWRDALLVPIPKKGDLTRCDKWRGLNLLDTMGKLFTEVIQIRLQRVVEDVVPDSQCGFRGGRDCVDI